jgi:hypothetical protein
MHTYFKMTRKLLSIFVLSISLINISLADSVWTNRLSQEQLAQQGRLLQIKIVPDKSQLQVFLVGRKGAQLDLSHAKLRATFRTPKGEVHLLDVTKDADHFSLKEKTRVDANKLILQAEFGSDSETFSLDLK